MLNVLDRVEKQLEQINHSNGHTSKLNFVNRPEIENFLARNPLLDPILVEGLQRLSEFFP